MKQQGYLFVDHRASPGLTPEQARFCGYDAGFAREGGFFEADTLTCSHCKCVVIKNPERERARTNCRACNHFICDGCAAEAATPDYIHRPFLAKVEAAYANKGLIL